MINLVHDRRTRRRKSRRKRKAAAGVVIPLSPEAGRATTPPEAARPAVPPTAPDKTRAEIMAELDELGVTYAARAKKDELAGLLWAATIPGGPDGDSR